MKRVIPALLALLIAAATQQKSSAADVTNSFDAADQGWKVITLADNGPYSGLRFGPYTPTLSTSGGNPGGYISFLDTQGTDDTFYFDAPTAFLGNQLSSYGLRLLYEIRTSGGEQEWVDADVVLVGNNGVVLVVDTGPNPGPAWSRRSVVLHETAGWRIGSLTGPTPMRSQFINVISDLASLRIRGEFMYGFDTGYLDNVVLESGRIEMSIRVSEVEVLWNSIPNRKYQVQRRTEIETSPWSDLGLPLVGTGDTMRVTDQILDGSPKRFYRVVEIP